VDSCLTPQRIGRPAGLPNEAASASKLDPARSLFCASMSAFGGKADMLDSGILLAMWNSEPKNDAWREAWEGTECTMLSLRYRLRSTRAR